MMATFAVWGKYTFVPEEDCPTVTGPMHSYQVPAALTVGYLISLPLLRVFSERVFSKTTDVKLLLKESMVLYNVAQVLLNGWMVYKFIDALVNKGHPFVGDINTVHTGASYAVWVHYCDKYLEFFDTYFMVLRGKMDQVRSVTFSRVLLFYKREINELLLAFARRACFRSVRFSL
jgi:elongation of very long chain fatty acids protein 4